MQYVVIRQGVEEEAKDATINEVEESVRFIVPHGLRKEETPYCRANSDDQCEPQCVVPHVFRCEEPTKGANSFSPQEAYPSKAMRAERASTITNHGEAADGSNSKAYTVKRHHGAEYFTSLCPCTRTIDRVQDSDV
jgi:hypothetical protein